MGYQLKETNEEDIHRVIENAKEDEKKYHVFMTACERNLWFPEHWAIDDETGNYLLLAPTRVTRMKTLRNIYYIFFEGKYYELENPLPGISVINIRDVPGTESLMNSLQENIKAAFEVHGRTGTNGGREKFRNIKFTIGQEYSDEFIPKSAV